MPFVLSPVPKSRPVLARACPRAALWHQRAARCTYALSRIATEAARSPFLLKSGEGLARRQKKSYTPPRAFRTHITTRCKHGGLCHRTLVQVERTGGHATRRRRAAQPYGTMHFTPRPNSLAFIASEASGLTPFCDPTSFTSEANNPAFFMPSRIPRVATSHTSHRDLLPLGAHVSARSVLPNIAAPHCEMRRDFWTNRQGGRTLERRQRSCTRIFLGKRRITTTRERLDRLTQPD